MSSSLKKFVCDYCPRSFRANFNLRRHIRYTHPDAVLPELRRGRKPKTENRVRCDVCGDEVSNRRALIYHRKRKHPANATRKRLCAEKRTMEFATKTGVGKYYVGPVGPVGAVSQ